MDRQPTNDVLLLPTSDTSDGFRPKGTPLRGGVFVLANTYIIYAKRSSGPPPFVVGQRPTPSH